MGFDKCLDILRKNNYVANNEDEFAGGAKGGAGSNFFRLKESAYENLSFPDNMSYEKSIYTLI
jgi:dynein heavy chain